MQRRTSDGANVLPNVPPREGRLGSEDRPEIPEGVAHGQGETELRRQPSQSVGIRARHREGDLGQNVLSGLERSSRVCRMKGIR